MSTGIHLQVEQIHRNEHPRLVCRVSSGYVVMAEKQVLRGYCLLLPDPVVADLNALPPQPRSRFLSDMALVGDALLNITNAARINYEILGNLEPALHGHIVPRYDDESEQWRTKPFWFYNWQECPLFNPEDDRQFLEELRAELQSIGGVVSA